MKTQLTLSQAIAAYLDEAHAERLSPHTIADYSNSFRHLRAYLVDDRPLAAITADDLIGFFAGLALPRSPAGIAARPSRPIGAKQALNIHTGLSALWSWAMRRGYTAHHVVHDIRRPKPERPAITPLTEGDIKAILAGCDRSIAYARRGQAITDYTRPTAQRDRAIILLLIDTGIRASELSALRLLDIDLRNRTITVFGKGAKERSLPIGPITARALARHITGNRADAPANAPLFLGLRGEALTRDALQKLLRRLGEQAKVSNVHPHRFRHTFAIQYLRNGGNTRALQEALGHETLDMIRTYTRIAEADLVNGHRTASPVENWRL